LKGSGAIRVAKAVAKVKAFRKLELNGNAISEDTLRKVRDILSQNEKDLGGRLFSWLNKCIFRKYSFPLEMDDNDEEGDEDEEESEEEEIEEEAEEEQSAETDNLAEKLASTSLQG
jgi:Ran GTPase-activating protein (RanGAP) involved in mRNA processing and transport